MKRLLLFADHRWRDTPALALIRHLLDSLGDYRVYIASFDVHQPAVELVKPHLVLLNHLHGQRNRWIADTVQRRGGLVAILPTEGRPSTDDLAHWIATDWPPRLCDLYLSWSETFADLFPEQVKRAVVGCPRFDFYSEPYNVLLPSRADARGLYDLDPARPVVTVASSFPQAKFAYQSQSFNDQDWRDLGMTKVPGREDPGAVARAEHQALQTFRQWLSYLRTELPDAQVVVKPHPAEDVQPWQVWCDTAGVRLMLTDYVWTLLAMADVHVTRTNCLTTTEAWMLGKATVQCQIGNVVQSGAGLEATWCSPMADSALQLVEYVSRSLLDGPFKDPGGSWTDAYLARWLGPRPGAALRIAHAIHNLVMDRDPKTHAEPTLQDEIDFHRLLTEHERQHAEPKADGIGQYAKSMRRADVEEWARRVRGMGLG